jgi:hypothetical protein
MINRFDFWLPLRRYDQEKKDEIAQRKLNKSWCENMTFQKPKVTKMSLNDKMFDNPKV